MYRWKQIRINDSASSEAGDELAGERLHPRYILTNIGGIRYEGGLDPGGPHETTDVSLLTEELWLKRWEQYRSFAELSPQSRWAFEPADGVDSDGQPVHVVLGSG